MAAQINKIHPRIAVGTRREWVAQRGRAATKGVNVMLSEAKHLLLSNGESRFFASLSMTGSKLFAGKTRNYDIAMQTCCLSLRPFLWPKKKEWVAIGSVPWVLGFWRYKPTGQTSSRGYHYRLVHNDC